MNNILKNWIITACCRILLQSTYFLSTLYELQIGLFSKVNLRLRKKVNSSTFISLKMVSITYHPSPRDCHSWMIWLRIAFKQRACLHIFRWYKNFFEVWVVRILQENFRFNVIILINTYFKFIVDAKQYCTKMHC